MSFLSNIMNSLIGSSQLPELQSDYSIPNLFPSISEIPLNQIEGFNGKYGINLDKIEIDTCLKDLNKSPITATTDSYVHEIQNFQSPLQISYRQGFEFFCKKINDFILKDGQDEGCRFSANACDNGVVFSALLNIKHPDTQTAEQLKKTYGDNVSMFNVICQVLKDEGYIKDKGVVKISDQKYFIFC